MSPREDLAEKLAEEVWAFFKAPGRAGEGAGEAAQWFRSNKVLGGPQWLIGQFRRAMIAAAPPLTLGGVEANRPQGAPPEECVVNGGPHPSHDLRDSDASTFDVICKKCGQTDVVPGSWGKLVEPCPKPAPPDECVGGGDETAWLIEELWISPLGGGTLYVHRDFDPQAFLAQRDLPIGRQTAVFLTKDSNDAIRFSSQNEAARWIKTKLGWLATGQFEPREHMWPISAPPADGAGLVERLNNDANHFDFPEGESPIRRAACHIATDIRAVLTALADAEAQIERRKDAYRKMVEHARAGWRLYHKLGSGAATAEAKLKLAVEALEPLFDRLTVFPMTDDDDAEEIEITITRGELKRIETLSTINQGQET